MADPTIKNAAPNGICDNPKCKGYRKRAKISVDGDQGIKRICTECTNYEGTGPNPNPLIAAGPTVFTDKELESMAKKESMTRLKMLDPNALLDIVVPVSQVTPNLETRTEKPVPSNPMNGQQVHITVYLDELLRIPVKGITTLLVNGLLDALDILPMTNIKEARSIMELQDRLKEATANPHIKKTYKKRLQKGDTID